MDHLFNKLDTFYPSKWRDQFRSHDELVNWKESWAEEFENEQITFDEIKVAIEYCKKKYIEWPPTFPQFLKACRPSLDYETAFYEAVSQMQLRSEGKDEWSNPAIFHAAARIGMDMSNPYAYIKTRWKTELDKAIYDVSAGNSSSVIEKRVNPSGYLGAPKREQGNYTSSSLQSLASIKEILDRIPAWKIKKNNPGEQEGATA
ncbi:replication protein P [Nitrosomonas communis]|uniref:replication protein P n=1 Tax=Nitrosomonas communis TaxID=44574 RepID=UPI003D2D6E09